MKLVSTAEGFDFALDRLKFPYEVLTWVGEAIWLTAYFTGRVRRVLAWNLPMTELATGHAFNEQSCV